MNPPFTFAVALLAVRLLVCTFPLHCHGATAELSPSHLSRVWQEEFTRPANRPPAVENQGAASAYPADTHRKSEDPHPAVARIVVPEQGATSYGSGTLIDVRERFGLVITNWHVVRDAQGMVEVMFPGGFTSKARALKVDADWDLAALVIWRPPIQPVAIAAAAPQPGDQLTICGYGPGIYRAATGHCTQYYAPRTDFPRQMVELDVEARQGDSGGPIFNRRGELAGVLFGAGQGTTLGSFGGRVDSFLATLAPDIGTTPQHGLADTESHLASAQEMHRHDSLCSTCQNSEPLPSDTQQDDAHTQPSSQENSQWPDSPPELASIWPPEETTAPPPGQQAPPLESTSWRPVARNNWFDQLKTVLAAVGVVAIAVLVLRAAR